MAQDTVTRAPVTRAQVWRLAWPIMLANISLPLVGIADTAVIGNVGNAAALGAIANGSMIFTLLLWSFGFLRMGTTGLSAQAVGAGDETELRLTLYRAVLVGGVLGIVLILLQGPVADLGFHFLKMPETVADPARLYFDIRIWSAPATFAVYAITGWFIGLQDSRTVLVLQLFLNIINLALNLVLVLAFEMGVAGIALGTLIAEWLTLALALALVLRTIGNRSRNHSTKPITRALLLEPIALVRTFSVNRDILIRTLFLIAAIFWFTAQSNRLGEVELAANHILMQFGVFSAYFLDSWAIAAEGLVGQAVGRRSRTALTQAVYRSTELAALTALLLTLAYFLLGGTIIYGMTDIDAVRAAAVTYLPFAALHPILGVWAFQFDGIFVGATRGPDMRNTMAVSFAIYIAVWWLLAPYGNTGLWIAFLTFFIARAATMAVRYPAIVRSVS